MGTGHAPSLAHICDVLETQETGRPATAEGTHTDTHTYTHTRRHTHTYTYTDKQGHICIHLCTYTLMTFSLSLSVSQGDYSAAVSSLQTCLSVLSRALPSTTFDLACSLSWNLIRYCLHRPTPLGWLVRLIGGKHGGEESQISSRDAALVYHQLGQLQLTGVCVCVCLYKIGTNEVHSVKLKLGVCVCV